MAFINKEKVLNGFENAAHTLEEGLKSAGEKLEDIVRKR